MFPVTLPRNAQLWLPGYLRQRVERTWRREPIGPVDVLFCVADHFEPGHGGADAATERRRVARWLSDYPALAASFRDAEGRPVTE